jgi:hypothetical protein
VCLDTSPFRPFLPWSQWAPSIFTPEVSLRGQYLLPGHITCSTMMPTLCLQDRFFMNTDFPPFFAGLQVMIPLLTPLSCHQWQSLTTLSLDPVYFIQSCSFVVILTRCLAHPLLWTLEMH